MKHAKISYKFREYIRSIIDLFDKRLEQFMLRNYNSYPYMRYMLNSGKRIRPILTALSYQAVGGEDVQESIPLAIGIELVHNATLIHDDIIDNDAMRRGKKAIHEKLGRTKAIILGDMMIALAVNMVADYGTGITKMLSGYGFELCEGEILDLSLSLSNCNERRYLEKIRKKSVSLFKASTEGGAIAGNGSKKEIKSLANFGSNLGIAYQINDDLYDFMTNNNDLENGTATLPLIHLYENSDKRTRALIDKNFGRNITKNFIKILRKEMEKTNSIEYCEKKITENIENARKNLRNLKKSEFRDYLLEIPDFILSS